METWEASSKSLATRGPGAQRSALPQLRDTNSNGLRAGEIAPQNASQKHNRCFAQAHGAPLCDEVEGLGPVLTSFLLLFLSDGRDIMSGGVCNRCGKVGLAVGRAAVVPDLSVFRVLASVLLCSLCGPGLLALPRWTTSMLTRASWTAVLGTARALFKRLPAGSEMPSMWARGAHGEPVRAPFAVVKT